MFENRAEKLGAQALERLRTETVIVSCASLLEVAVKKRKGKLDMPDTAKIIATLQLKTTPILDIQAQQLSKLPGIESTAHADPFDLLLIAQAMSEGLPFLTCDIKILEINHPDLRLIDGRL